MDRFYEIIRNSMYLVKVSILPEYSKHFFSEDPNELIVGSRVLAEKLSLIPHTIGIEDRTTPVSRVRVQVKKLRGPNDVSRQQWTDSVLRSFDARVTVNNNEVYAAKTFLEYHEIEEGSRLDMRPTLV